MGFLDKLRGKKGEGQKEMEKKDEPETSGSASGRKIKRYTSEGKPID